MKVTNLVQQPSGWRRFHLSVGGFVIKNCRWRPASGQIFFPRRYDKNHYPHKVVFAYSAQVKRLRDLLMSGKTETPRDRRPCILKIHGFGESYGEEGQLWLMFNFTVRGFTILGCRWQPDSGSIQLPVTFTFDDQHTKWVKKAVVCAYGAHINRLRGYLQAEWLTQHPVQEEVLEEVAF
jgi:hypothetical protein